MAKKKLPKARMMSGIQLAMIVVTIERLEKENKELKEKLNQAELAEIKSRMELEEANQRIEQLEENIHGILDFVSPLAEFNPAFYEIQKMAKEGLDERD